jgi:hypothetical protein
LALPPKLAPTKGVSNQSADADRGASPTINALSAPAIKTFGTRIDTSHVSMRRSHLLISTH